MPANNIVTNQDLEELFSLYRLLSSFENNPVVKICKKDLEWILKRQSHRKWSHRKFNTTNKQLEAQGYIKSICRGVVVILKENLND